MRTQNVPTSMSTVAIRQLQKPRNPASICAKLVTTRDGRREEIVIGLNRPVSIGRNPYCTYVLDTPQVSGTHCKIHAVRSENGGVILSCQDLSTHGIRLNEYLIKRSSVILMDGDILQIPFTSHTFKCVHVWKDRAERMRVFDPTPPPHISYKTIGSYTLTSQTLGSGAYATVNLALDVNNVRQVACKSIRIMKDVKTHQVMKEVAILMGLNHPNINQIYDTHTEEDRSFIHIFLQLCTGGDLFTYITGYTEKGKLMCEAEAKFIMFQLLKALEYLHDRKIAHRDVKPENILLHGPGPYPRIMIGDFGLARLRSHQATFTVSGTVPYLPPEGISALDEKKEYLGIPGDCWSLGLVLYIMLTGTHPFDYEGGSSFWAHSSESMSEDGDHFESFASSELTRRVKERILKGKIDFDRDPWKYVPDAKILVQSLLERNPLHRSTIYDVIASPWIVNELQSLQSVYQRKVIDPEMNA